MKRYFLVLIALIMSVGTYATEADTTLPQTKKAMRTRPAKAPACYLGLSTGINNAPGYFGLDFNIALSRFVTLDAGVGPCTWGNKLYVGSKYYLKENHRGWALGGGFTYSSGVENIKLRLNTVYGDRQRVSLALKPEDNLFVAISRYWNLGKKYNRFYVTFGKSVPLQPPHFHEFAGQPAITDQARQNVKQLAPGNFINGIMISTGFSFGLYRK